MPRAIFNETHLPPLVNFRGHLQAARDGRGAGGACILDSGYLADERNVSVKLKLLLEILSLPAIFPSVSLFRLLIAKGVLRR